MRWAKRVLPVLLVSAWFLYLIRGAFKEHFNVDDVTNLCVAFDRGYEFWIKGSVLFWTGAIRPVGELFYLIIYQFAGYNHVPFRVATFAVLVLNLALLYAFFRKLPGSLWFAVLALVIVCYSGDMVEMYTSTGTIYDTLCLTFMLLGLLCVMRERPRWILAALCCIAAVDSKEMGVALPAIILAYEVIIRRKPRLSAVVSTGIVSLVFLISRMAVHNMLSDLPAYQLTITWARYLETTRTYLNDLIFHGHLSDGLALMCLLAALAIAAVLRNRLMLFGWCYYTLALMPMSFATPRSGYAAYVPFAGAAIYVAALLFELLNRVPATPRAVGIAVAILLAMRNEQRQERFLTKNNLGHPGGEETVRAVADGIGGLHPTMPKGAHLLLINDPFENDEELPHSTLRLKYRDLELKTTRLNWKRGPGTIPYPPEPFDSVFLFTGLQVWELPRNPDEKNIQAEPRSYITMDSPYTMLSIVKDVGDGPGDRWVHQDPEFLFRVPDRPAHFEMNYNVPEILFKQIETVDIDAWIAGEPAAHVQITKPNRYTYSAPIPANAKAGEVVSVRFHIRRPFIASGDGAKLSFLLTSLGFVPD